MGPRRAVAAAVSDVRRTCAGALFAALVAVAEQAGAQEHPAPSQPLGEAEILGRHDQGLRVESVTTRITSFDQYGYGYQSQAGPLLGRGSERATILEPQLQIVAFQGDRLRHVLTVPVDVVSAASPDAIDTGPKSADVVSGASRKNVAGTIDWSATDRVDPASDVSMRIGLHLEEPFRSWHGGIGGSHAFADGDTVVAASAIEVFDWFDRFDITGHRQGRTDRSSTTGSIGITQVVTPTTVVTGNYGLTVQRGELGNTWNSVPLATMERGPEILPDERVRHALVGRMSQFLPWNGALRLYYRFYADDWGLVAHSAEGQLTQRISPSVYVGALYRFHTQTGAAFFTTLAGQARQDGGAHSPGLSTNLSTDPRRTADSDLAPLQSHTIGGKIVIDLPLDKQVRLIHFELAYERYFRTNDLHMDIVTCATGYRF
jgi:hypothetical protein